MHASQSLNMQTATCMCDYTITAAHHVYTCLSKLGEGYAGASEEAVALADQAVTVPMSPSFTESFNVSGEPTMYDS